MDRLGKTKRVEGLKSKKGDRSRKTKAEDRDRKNKTEEEVGNHG
jgi:hypothetical protein